MVYRSPPEPPSSGRLVTVRRYLDPVVAHADCAHLKAAGIPAHVIETASYNPLLANSLGGVQLQVGDGDVERAEEILAASAPGATVEVDDGEGPQAVRCPRCELAYCFHERPSARRNAPGPALALVGLMGALVGPKRWNCYRCGHVWDDPEEGPAAMTPLVPGDPRPVFRLRRGHGGMGLFLGVMAGSLATLVIGGATGGLAAAALIGGAWMIGGRLRYDVCSEPQCRAPLPPDAEDCPRCKGAIAGLVTTAEAHYAAAADVRRELAALRRLPAATSEKAEKKARAKARTGSSDE
jgi:hypothetical protein